ncbi:hypothetical protein HBHAL_3433 [Halobacillus halophilus DSM 2266]|uniref:Uncharacterized protein n=1 Tax=Halobacillus halophilus (strain ATCC 35676 / DSM 2266 / JCM 20832 / KCTC 3685 / LMG 17431 / NBRC 102448 / NCIMB 2269) TaxID=866895 RepID=I0JNQ7_HALH3|nr:hypothetical protein HBHAL_3433 [Halobacillus halophilus DSM 2266]
MQWLERATLLNNSNSRDNYPMENEQPGLNWLLSILMNIHK